MKFLRWRKSYTFLHSVSFSYFYIGYCNVFENVIVTRDGENFIADYKLAIWYSGDASITKEETASFFKLQIEKFNDEDSIEKYDTTLQRKDVNFTVDYCIFTLHAIFTV